MTTAPAFARYIGIDYSGAQTPTASLKGLRVYMAEGDAVPTECGATIRMTVRIASPELLLNG